MQIRYYKEYSRYLDRDKEFKAFGHTGRPILIFPCRSGRFFDWENFGMCDAAAPWVESGRLQIFCCDSIDRESWDSTGPERPRIEMQERYYNYVTTELVSRILEINPKHPIFAALQKIYASDKEAVKEYADVLYTQAMLIEGFPVEDPMEFSRKVCDIMVKAAR